LQAKFKVLLCDLTGRYFECDPPANGKRRFGYSRDKRPACGQVIIALVATPERLPLAYEVMAGDPSEKTTLKAFLERIEQQETLAVEGDRGWPIHTLTLLGPIDRDLPLLGLPNLPARVRCASCGPPT
jgi:hypothetical protein